MNARAIVASVSALLIVGGLCLPASGQPPVPDTGKGKPNSSKEEPKKTKLRTWADSTGKHIVEAEFVEVKDREVRLKKADGSTVNVPLERLSEADQEFVNSQRKDGEADIRDVYFQREQRSFGITYFSFTHTARIDKEKYLRSDRSIPWSEFLGVIRQGAKAQQLEALIGTTDGYLFVVDVHVNPMEIAPRLVEAIRKRFQLEPPLVLRWCSQGKRVYVDVMKGKTEQRGGRNHPRTDLQEHGHQQRRIPQKR